MILEYNTFSFICVKIKIIKINISCAKSLNNQNTIYQIVYRYGLVKLSIKWKSGPDYSKQECYQNSITGPIFYMSLFDWLICNVSVYLCYLYAYKCWFLSTNDVYMHNIYWYVCLCVCMCLCKWEREGGCERSEERPLRYNNKKQKLQHMNWRKLWKDTKRKKQETETYSYT